VGTFCIAATFTYDLRGLLATRTLENGASSTYTYDAAARRQLRAALR
jgi:YD repeat-containing protein